MDALIIRRGGTGAAPAPTPDAWVRNPSWPACEANAGDNRVRGLYAVWPDNGNFIAMTVAGAYTVDYGDGTTTNYTTGSTAYYKYDYADADLAGTDAPVTFTDTGDLVTRTAHGYTDGMRVQFFNITSTTGIVNAQFYFVINATTNTFQVSATTGGVALALTTDGTGTLLPHKIATVTITPQGGSNLTSINFFVKHNQAGLVDGYSTGWLDIAIAAPSCTVLTIGSTTGSSTVRHSYLERVRLNQLGSITSFANLFRTICFRLKNVEISDTITSVTNTQFMFQGCRSIVSFSLFNTSNVTDMKNMFQNCPSISTVPLFNTSNVTDMQYMFQNGQSLVDVPFFNTSSVTNMTSMFQGCGIISTVPLFNTSSVQNMTTMFWQCTSLQTIPLFNTSAVTNMSSMFNSCNSLTSVPALVMTAVTSSDNFSSIFETNNNLTRIEAKNFRFTFSVSSCKLSGTALNEIYTNLPTVTSQTITVTGNYGTATDTPSIATAKGWTVTG